MVEVFWHFVLCNWEGNELRKQNGRGGAVEAGDIAAVFDGVGAEEREVQLQAPELARSAPE